MFYFFGDYKGNRAPQFPVKLARPGSFDLQRFVLNFPSRAFYLLRLCSSIFSTKLKTQQQPISYLTNRSNKSCHFTNPDLAGTTKAAFTFVTTNRASLVGCGEAAGKPTCSGGRGGGWHHPGRQGPASPPAETGRNGNDSHNLVGREGQAEHGNSASSAAAGLISEGRPWQPGRAHLLLMSGARWSCATFGAWGAN